MSEGRLHNRPPEAQLEHLESHLVGIEIDAFAAWMTRVFLQLSVYPVSRRASRALRLTVRTADALDEALGAPRRFDLVVGNPPFGRVTLSSRVRERYARSLYGHANLYGVFLDAALRWRNASGLVAFLTPTSFLGGQYFSRLRALLLDEAPPLTIDLLTDRTGVFPSVQQETCLAVFGPNPAKTAVVHLVTPANGGLKVTRAGSVSIGGGSPGAPWLLPRSPARARLARNAGRMRTRLHSLGYRASTGPLVWNRLKDQLRSRPSNGAYPLIWAEAVRPNEFRFEYRVRSEHRFVAVPRKQAHLLLARPCVLVQRTTAKEQRRRLVACHVPDEFLARWGKIVVENHVNVLSTSSGNPVSPRAMAAVLNTEAVDEVFRCLSGSVAVSATELHALPLPPRQTFEEVDRLLRAHEGIERDEAIEQVVAEAYGHTAS
jgi:adenine-specific DNA-methyltransferase